MNTIVFLHGHAGSKNTFHFIQKHFPSSVAFDLPGFGDAPKPDVIYDRDFFVTFLEGKIKKPVTLVGYSMGAVIAKAFALKYPQLVKKLILIGYPMQKTHEELIRVYRHNLLYRQYVDKSELSRLLCRMHDIFRLPALAFVWLSKPKYYVVRQDWFKHTYHSAISSLHATTLADDWHDLRKLKDKTLLVVGERDRFVDRSLLSEFRYVNVPKMAHWIFDYDDDLAAIIRHELNSKTQE